VFRADEKQLLRKILEREPGISPETVARLYDELIDRDFALPESPPRATRWDHEVIESLVPQGAKVLDLGCGSGELLARLMEHKGVFGQGIERDPDLAAECLLAGVPVIQADIDAGLGFLQAGLFEYVVLEETLQTVHRPLVVLQEMLRVGHVGIVSFPNFGHWRIRMQLLLDGRMPTTPHLPYAWYETPNIHLLTIRDFEHLCEASRFFVAARWAYADGRARPLIPEDNLLAEEALYVMSARGPLG
jgi:methionine biosynthesis protein MetW